MKKTYGYADDQNPLPVVADGILSAEPDKISDIAGAGNVCSA